MSIVVSTLMKIGMSLLAELLTAAAIKNVLLHTAEHYAKKSESQLDDKLVEDIKTALGVK